MLARDRDGGDDVVDRARDRRRRSAAGGSSSRWSRTARGRRRRSAPRPRSRRAGRARASSRRRHAAYRSASARRSSTPSPGRSGSGRTAPPSGSRKPSNSIRSMRTWSWNHSRWRSFGTAASAWVWMVGAEWPERSSSWASATRGRREQAGDAAAARRVGLQAVDGADETDGSRPASLRTRRRRCPCPAGARSRSRRSPSRSSELTGSSNQVDAELGEPLGEAQRLLHGQGAVRVDEQLGFVADRLAGGADPLQVGARLAADLHLHPRDALVDPAAELLAQLAQRVRAEAAAAVDRHLVVRAARAATRARRRAASPSGPRARRRRPRAPSPPAPGSPVLRSAPRIAGAPRRSSNALLSSIAGASSRRPARDGAGPYVQPMPVSPLAATSTTTIVVESQANVPSDSGGSVGIV